MSKLHATITNESGTTVSKGGNSTIVINLKIGNKEVGNVSMRYEECNGTTICYYPITENTGKGGRTLLHYQKSTKQQGSTCNICRTENCPNAKGTGFCNDIPT